MLKTALSFVYPIVLLLTIGVSAPETHGAVLRVRALGDPQTLDWNRAHTWMDGFLIYNLMEGLVGIDEKLNPVPRLASKWTISENNTVYTFQLRKDVRWSDGVPLKSYDFVSSWRRLLSPATKSRYASVLFDIENAEEFNSGKITDFSKVGVKALDGMTLQVKLRAPMSYWYWITTSYSTFPIRQDLIDKNSSGWDKAGNMVTLGPYTLASHETGRRIVLKKNPHYYGTTGNITEIAFALISDDSTALRLYQVNQLDFLPKLPPLDKKRLKNRPDFKDWPELRTVHLRFNSQQNPTSDARVRRAIAMSIDRSKLEKIFEKQFQPATALVPPGMLGYSKKAGMPFNPEKAKAELKSAGLDPQKLPPLDLLTVSFDDLVILAQFVQDELKRNLGLNVRIHILEPKRYYSPLLNHSEYAMQINLWGADFPDADNFYSIFLSNSSLNRYKWKSSEYDELVMSARTSADEKEREKRYFKAQRILLQDSVATTPLFYGRIGGLVRKTIQGFNPGPMNWWMFKDLSITPVVSSQ